MRVAIVHHWLVTLGGGERVLEAIASLFPGADIFTLIADEEGIPAGIRNHNIKQSFLANIPGARRLHRHLLPLYPLAVEHLDLRGYDLILTSDAGPMKGVLVSPGTVHVCYCHAPMRYLWSHFHEYRESLSGPAKLIFSAAAHYVRAWDFAAAQRVTVFAANSENVAGRIRQYYARPSMVLYPPVSGPADDLELNGDGYLAVGRLVRYKRMDLLIESCNRVGRKLRIIGTGPEEHALRSMAGPSVEFLGLVSDADLWHEYAHCRALLFAAEEDFGMTPVEAQACGKPVIAYGKGGALESIVGVSMQRPPGRSTGIFFREQTEADVSRAILEFEEHEHAFDHEFIRDWAKQFDRAHFLDGFRHLVDAAMAAREDGFAQPAFNQPTFAPYRAAAGGSRPRR
jgi:glycosyltransferase involved in cell wall biosynthesis